MNLTAHHAKLFAHELTKRSSSDNVDKLASALSCAQVERKPRLSRSPKSARVSCNRRDVGQECKSDIVLMETQ